MPYPAPFLRDLRLRESFVAVNHPAQTVDRDGNAREIEIGGRHDLCIVPRIVPVVEAMTAIALADLALQNRAARIG